MTSLAEAPQKVAPDAGLYRLTAAQYVQMIDAGVFRPCDKVELLHGELVRKMPNNSPHGAAVAALISLLGFLSARGYTLWVQSTTSISADTMPEPDVAVVQGKAADYFAAHPTAARMPLVIEVAESSLAQDLGLKAALYAAARIPEYWVVDLVDRKVHVHTLPRRGKNPGYKSVAVVDAAGVIPLILRGESFGTVAAREYLP